MTYLHLMLGKMEGRRRGWWRMRWLDDITDPMDMLQSIGLQRVAHNLATEQQVCGWLGPPRRVVLPGPALGRQGGSEGTVLSTK